MRALGGHFVGRRRLWESCRRASGRRGGAARSCCILRSHTRVTRFRRGPYDQCPFAIRAHAGGLAPIPGAARDGISRARGLASGWPDGGPPVLWRIDVGQGYAAPSVVDGRVYFNDYDESQNTWMVRCLSLDDGQELWRYEVAKRIRANHAITRTAPATDGGLVVAIDPKCEVHCIDARDGSLIWKLNLPAAYRCAIPPWYNGQCPLLEGRRLILAVGGSALMVVPRRGNRKTGLGSTEHGSLAAFTWLGDADRNRRYPPVCIPDT